MTMTMTMPMTMTMGMRLIYTSARVRTLKAEMTKSDGMDYTNADMYSELSEPCIFHKVAM